jgi:hypothetical protein
LDPTIDLCTNSSIRRGLMRLNFDAGSLRRAMNRNSRLRLGIVGPRLSEAERDALRSNVGAR